MNHARLHFWIDTQLTPQAFATLLAVLPREFTSDTDKRDRPWQNREAGHALPKTRVDDLKPTTSNLEKVIKSQKLLDSHEVAANTARRDAYTSEVFHPSYILSTRTETRDSPGKQLRRWYTMYLDRAGPGVRAYQ